ncbi:unnamed protein product [Kluyveromyces dobzhanskii CBS 2104]|uniref:WGS project CCBQ000000000 data, contig 00107 n=1 Tax=Kluyveromyces dobzhanskii CBS 2104 TaxID=1427455 RepID=A0A0A8KZ58_9SACH|nr:unnamed protein product [Kluyveromyces dobzhanskii CBS 2104]
MKFQIVTALLISATGFVNASDSHKSKESHSKPSNSQYHNYQKPKGHHQNHGGYNRTALPTFSKDYSRNGTTTITCETTALEPKATFAKRADAVSQIGDGQIQAATGTTEATTAPITEVTTAPVTKATTAPVTEATTAQNVTSSTASLSTYVGSGAKQVASSGLLAVVAMAGSLLI